MNKDTLALIFVVLGLIGQILNFSTREYCLIVSMTGVILSYIPDR